MLAPLRVTGLGGAFAGYAEGVDAISANAAAAAVREPYSATWFDWDITVGAYLPATFRSTDFDNDGRVGFTYENFVFGTAGLSLKWGPFGVGLLGDVQRYDLSPNANPTDPRVTTTLARAHLVAGYSLADGAVTIGGGLRGATLAVDIATSALERNVPLAMTGAAPEIGVLVRPNDAPWRIGATYRMAVDGSARFGTITPGVDGLDRAGGLVVPASVHLPWEIEAGFALQVGPRPLNPRWRDPRGHEAEARSRYWNWPRERITVVGEVLVAGPSPGSVSLESFLAQQDDPSGRRTTVTPRLGLESEPIVDRLQSRLGTYVEPSRFEGHASRQHFTFGFELRLGAWSMFGLAGEQVWRISAVADLAPRYENFGLSIGAWH